MLREFLAETKAQVNDSWDLKDAARFIKQHTYHRGAKFSFVDHEFQETIVSDPAQIVNTQKCSQIGMSEVTARWTVAVTNMIPDFSAIITFPFSGDAEAFAKTRVDPFVEGSPRLREAVNPRVNNSEIKQFNTSLLYFRGTNGRTAAISIPADAIISDEIDRSDPHVLSQYTSRLTHSSWRLRRNFSTPTIPGYGIALEMETSLRYRNICKCNHCNHTFLPDFFEHVKIPGYDNDLRSLTKANLSKTRYNEAQLLCPNCFKVPDLGPQCREYVLENSLANFEAHGYFVSPFDAPKIISIVDLLRASVSYARYSEFMNQNLGITAEDSSEAITLSDLNKAIMQPGSDLKSSQLHCMGIDMGNICYITIGRLTQEGQFLVVWRERCVISKLEERKAQLQREWRTVITVMDSQPFIDTVQRFQRTDKNLYGAVYSNSKKLESFQIKMFEGDEEEGKLAVHTCQINRDKCLDMLLGVIKAGEMVVAPISADEDELFTKQMLDMRRVQVFDTNQELTWQWVKSKDGNDHFHHSTLYLYVACQLRGTASRSVSLAGVSILRSFKVKSPNIT